MPAEVVVFLPGIMGSELRDGDDIVWPGSPLEIVLPYERMDQLLKKDLTVTDVIRRVSIVSQYESLIGALKECGFREDSSPPSLFPCPYDWRKDNRGSADVLANKIDEISKLYEAECEINLVCHSMGGLIARYYLESGKYSGRAGFLSVRRLLTLATPHRGAPMALLAALGHEKRAFLSREQVQRIANDESFPSLYQLLPPRGEPFAWSSDPDDRYGSIDIYADSVVQYLGLCGPNISAAAEFHAALDVSRRPSTVRYFLFAGTQQETVCNVLVDMERKESAKAVRRVERADGGDGTVPFWSAALTGLQSTPVDGEHGSIYKGALLQRVLGTLLGRPGVLATSLPDAELFLRDTVVDADAETHAVLKLSAPVGSIAGGLRLVRYVDANGKGVVPPAVLSTLAISYSGVPVDKLSIKIVAPEFAGVYRIEFVPNGGQHPLAADDLIVQRKPAH